MKYLTLTLMAGVAAFTISTSANAQDASTSANVNAQTMAQTETSAGGDTAMQLEQLNDDSLVMLTGKVAEIDDDEFTLNYGGNNMITVELDRFGFEGDETEFLSIGESVTVSGYIDDDLFEGREIEALDVRLNDSYVYYYYDTPVITQSYGDYNSDQNNNMMEDGSFFSMTGSVTAIDGMMATVEGQNQTMTVDMSELGYNPTDEEGMQKIEIGDRIYVYGSIDDNFFSNKELVAQGLVEMRQRSSNNNTQTNSATNTNAAM